MNGKPRISVVMVSYRTGPALLDAVRAIGADPDIAELIVVDNGNSAADRVALLGTAQTTGKARLLQGHGNVGFARACNYGARLAGGDYLLFLNPDAVVEHGAACKLVEAGRDCARPWIAGALILDAQGREQRGARRGALTVVSALAGFTGLHRLPGLPSIHRHAEPMPVGPVPMPTVSGAAMMMNRMGFEAVGGFDEGYFLHVEDIALCRTVRQAGGTVLFVPGARVMHHGATSDVAHWRVERHKLRGFLRYFRTAGPGAGPLIATVLLAPLIAGAITGRLIWTALRRR
ncbi:glycosyltransferase family 2 protein [uncultured Algimonas sp.]|uniref:glycosyltransferase family 2 protein n=1 Tax=uncultured Algimonas sp. TaxID=1547920 RepID=UPI0026212DCB|nr:glycosyltransferase family 2 protein [uncultured Algimonas sp.]